MDELFELQKLQLQAHFYEYQAVMTRINWFMSLQFIPLAPLAGFLAFIFIVRNSHPILVVLGAAWVTQCAIFVYYFALHEVYNHVRYLLTTLKPKVAILLQLDTNLFWGWEEHLKKFGKANDPRFGDFVPAAISLIAFIISAFIAITNKLALSCDFFQMIVFILFLVLLFSQSLGAVVLARRVAQVRREYEATIS
jgi:hypothetical protein